MGLEMVFNPLAPVHFSTFQRDSEDPSRADSAVKGTGYSSRGPRFNAHHPHGSS